MNRDFALAAAGNTLAFWGHEKIGIKIEPGVDEVALALTADAWSRTYRSSAVTIAANDGVILTYSGVRLVPDRVAANANVKTVLSPVVSKSPAKAVDIALGAIDKRYGRRTSAFVALQLEYAVGDD